MNRCCLNPQICGFKQHRFIPATKDYRKNLIAHIGILSANHTFGSQSILLHKREVNF